MVIKKADKDETNIRKYMKSDTFNIFQILEKDDKELIHSSFLQFLLTESIDIYPKMFGIQQTIFKPPILEKSYNIPNTDKQGKKNTRKRIDIEVTSIDERIVVAIENKFKSFPYEQQLLSYDRVYDNHHLKKEKYKILICFDKRLISFETDWKVLDYGDLLSFIKNNCINNTNNIKQIFIQQYCSFLESYYEKYQLLINDSKELFLKPYNNEKKFWLRLIYSALHLELIQYFEEKHIEVRFDLNPASTSVPLLNIVPKNWTKNNKELLIQFQGNDIKFYCHSKDKNFVEVLVEKSKEQFPDRIFDYKKMTKRDANSYFIFKIKLTSLINSSELFTLKSIKHELLCLYHDIDEKIITANSSINN